MSAKIAIISMVLTSSLCYLDLQEVDVIAILGPFLDVIRSEDTTGPITGYALSAVNKFLCYGLIGKFPGRMCYHEAVVNACGGGGGGELLEHIWNKLLTTCNKLDQAIRLFTIQSCSNKANTRQNRLRKSSSCKLKI